MSCGSSGLGWTASATSTGMGVGVARFLSDPPNGSSAALACWSSASWSGGLVPDRGPHYQPLGDRRRGPRHRRRVGHVERGDCLVSPVGDARPSPGPGQRRLPAVGLGNASPPGGSSPRTGSPGRRAASASGSPSSCTASTSSASPGHRAGRVGGPQRRRPQVVKTLLKCPRRVRYCSGWGASWCSPWSRWRRAGVT